MIQQCALTGRGVVCYRIHAEKAIDIITSILPDDHLLLASSKRVKGLWSLLTVHLLCEFVTSITLVKTIQVLS